MERVGFTMRLLPGREAEYRRRHAEVWPEMLDALKAAGVRDYWIFLHGDQPYTIGPDSVVILGPAFRFDSTNVNDFDF